MGRAIIVVAALLLLLTGYKYHRLNQHIRYLEGLLEKGCPEKKAVYVDVESGIVAHDIQNFAERPDRVILLCGGKNTWLFEAALDNRWLAQKMESKEMK